MECSVTFDRLALQRPPPASEVRCLHVMKEKFWISPDYTIPSPSPLFVMTEEQRLSVNFEIKKVLRGNYDHLLLESHEVDCHGCSDGH